MGEDTLTRSMSRPLGDFPEQAEFPQDNGYTLAEEVEEATGPPGYEYLNEEGQKVLLNVSNVMYSVLLEYFASEKPLQMSQISRKVDPLRSNYCVLARIVCIY